MATSSITNGNSILDVESIVSQLMSIERRPITKIGTKIANKDIEISAFGMLKSKASALESALATLENPASYSAKSVSSSDESAVTATVTNGAPVGDVELKVVSSARAARMVANGFASETAGVGSGTLTLETGSYSTSAGVTTFSAAKTKSITVPQGTTLAGLKDLINDSGANVRANIVQTGATYSLVLSGSATGVENAVRVSTANVQNVPGGGAPDLTSLAYSAATGETSNASLLQSAQNAVVYVDGLRVERSTNVIDNAVSGVVFNLRKSVSLGDVSQASATTISVSEQSGQARNALNKVVSAYNDLVATYKSLSVSNTDASKRGVLNSDNTASTLISRMRQLLLSDGITYPTTDGSGNATTGKLLFAQLGVELQRDGTLSVNDTVFAAASSDGTIDKLRSGISIEAQTFLKSASSAGGLLDVRAQSASDAQAELNKRKQDLEDKLATTELNLRKRYAALDATLFKLDKINTSLQQTLDAMLAQRNE